MISDPSSMIVAVVFLAVALLAGVVISFRLADRKSDVLHGGYIESDDDKDCWRSLLHRLEPRRGRSKDLPSHPVSRK
jgi:hypothetical protein